MSTEAIQTPRNSELDCANEIKENKRLIAKFMGYIDNGDGEYLIHPDTNYDHSLNDFDWFLYHNSWEWLMPVVEKINTLDDYGYSVIIHQHYTEVYKNEPKPVVIISTSGDDCIKGVYNAVVEFIKWYNKK